MNSKKNNNYGLFLVKSIGFSYIVTLVLFILFAIILTYTNISESIIPVVNSIIMIIAIAFGAIYMTTKICSKGWLNGAIVGILYVVILIIISSIVNKPFKIDVFILLKIVIGFITGTVAGMIGVNIK